MKRYDDARVQYLAALNVRKTTLGEQHPVYVDTLTELRMAYKVKSYTEVEVLLKQKVEISRSSNDWNLEDKSLNSLVTLYTTMGRYSDIVPILRRRLEIHKLFPQPDPGYDAIVNKLAKVYTMLGQDDQAKPLLQQAPGAESGGSGLDPKAEVSEPTPQDWAPSPTPTLPAAVATTVAVMERKLEHTLSSPHDWSLTASEIPNAEYVAQTRRDYQGANWWEAVDAKWRLRTLGQITHLTPEERARLAATYDDLVFIEIYKYGDKKARELCEIRRGLLGEDHPDCAKCLSDIADNRDLDHDTAVTQRIIEQALELMKVSLEKSTQIMRRVWEF